MAGALEHERAFLSPLYKFLALHPRGSVRRVPGYVRFILKYLASEIAKCRHFDCVVELRDKMGAIRVDAQASDSRTGIGGWFPELGSSGVPIPVKSRWFALEVTKKDFPWICECGDTPSRVISALEPLGSCSH